MRRDRPFPAALHKGFLMIALVGAGRLDGHACLPLLVGIGLLQGDHRFAGGNGIVQGEAGAQAVPVFHQGVRAETQPGLLPAGFLIQHAVRIGRALVRVVAARFPAKVNRGIAGIPVLGRRDLGLIRPVFADETFQARPRFDERAVGSEMIVTGPAGQA